MIQEGNSRNVNLDRGRDINAEYWPFKKLITHKKSASELRFPAHAAHWRV